MSSLQCISPVGYIWKYLRGMLMDVSNGIFKDIAYIHNITARAQRTCTYLQLFSQFSWRKYGRYRGLSGIGTYKYVTFPNFLSTHSARSFIRISLLGFNRVCRQPGFAIFYDGPSGFSSLIFLLYSISLMRNFEGKSAIARNAAEDIVLKALLIARILGFELHAVNVRRSYRSTCQI